MTPRPATRSLPRRSSRRGNPGRGKNFFRHHIPNTTRPNPIDINNQGEEPDPRTPAAPVPKKIMFPSTIVSIGLADRFSYRKTIRAATVLRRFHPWTCTFRLVCRRSSLAPPPNSVPASHRTRFPSTAKDVVPLAAPRRGDQPFDVDQGIVRKLRTRGECRDSRGGDAAVDRLPVGGCDLDVGSVSRARRGEENHHGDPGAVRQRAQAEAGRRRSRDEPFEFELLGGGRQWGRQGEEAAGRIRPAVSTYPLTSTTSFCLREAKTAALSTTTVCPRISRTLSTPERSSRRWPLEIVPVLDPRRCYRPARGGPSRPSRPGRRLCPARDLSVR